jgi:hypothetical protein
MTPTQAAEQSPPTWRRSNGTETAAGRSRAALGREPTGEEMERALREWEDVAGSN